MRIEDVAQLCYEVNRAYCQSIGDNSQKPWDQADDWQKESNISGVQAALAMGSDVTPEKMHQSWFDLKASQGWVWGLEKNVDQKTHPCMVAYSELPAQQQAKDKLFIAIVTTCIAFGIDS